MTTFILFIFKEGSPGPKIPTTPSLPFIFKFLHFVTFYQSPFMIPLFISTLSPNLKKTPCLHSVIPTSKTIPPCFYTISRFLPLLHLLYPQTTVQRSVSSSDTLLSYEPYEVGFTPVVTPTSSHLPLHTFPSVSTSFESSVIIKYIPELL